MVLIVNSAVTIMEANVWQNVKHAEAEAASPRKKWVMAGRADKTGKKTQLEIGLFDCAKCKKTFRATLSKKRI
jgi:cytochrome c556